MNNTNNITLSICIPTYNGGERLEKLVRHIIKSDRSDIEIAISDNCSTDDTRHRIQSIDDRRIRLHENEENLGALGNGVRALQNGNGKYLMLLLDRDVIQIEYIDEYIDFLNSNDYGVVINQAHLFTKEFGCELTRDRKYYYIVKAPHPSYYTFRKDCFDKIDLAEEVTFNGYYPALISMNIAYQGKQIYLNGSIPIILEAEMQYISMHSSRSWNALGKMPLEKIKNGSFTPDAQIGLIGQYIQYLLNIDLSDEELYYAVIGIYTALIENTMDYFHVLESTRNKHRYNVPDLHYSFEDYIGLAEKFFENFVDLGNKYNISYDRKIFEKITELTKRKFINECIPQLQSDYEENEHRISSLEDYLGKLQICENIIDIQRDINMRGGISHESKKGGEE